MKRLTTLVLFLLLASLLSGCGGKPSQNADSSIPVKVMTVTKTAMNTNYSTLGRIEASTDATIAPKVSGRVAQVNVKLGDMVKQGQVLFQLEAQNAHNQVTQSAASLGITRSSYDSAAQALKDAQSNYDRIKSLYENGVGSKKELEDAETNLVNAEISLEQSQQQINQAEATLGISQDNFNDYSVTAPIDGLIGAINVEIGEMVSSQTDAASIVSINTVKVEASVPERVVNTIAPGSKVQVKIDSLNKTVEGTLTTVAPKAKSTTMGYQIEVVLDNPSGEIKPGMATTLNLFTGSLADIISVPVDTVIEQDGQNIVYVVENDKAKEVTVEIGASNDSQVEITQGLDAGQVLVVDGNRLLSDGQQVRVVTGPGGGSK